MSSEIRKFERRRFIPANVGVSVNTNNIVRAAHVKHEHEFIEIAYVHSGSALECIDDKEYTVHRGQLVFINYKQIHSFTVEESAVITDILIDPAWISEKLIDTDNAFELLTLSSFSSFGDGIDTGMSLITFNSKERTLIEHIIETMRNEYKERSIGYETVLKSYVTVLLTLIFRKMSGTDKKEFTLTPEFLQYIRDHCDEKLTLSELSRSCFYNPSYFSRLFREHYGITLTDFILNSRFERACELLRDTALSAEEIAVQSGFGNKSTLYKVFREKTGFTPGEYRKELQ